MEISSASLATLHAAPQMTSSSEPATFVLENEADATECSARVLSSSTLSSDVISQLSATQKNCSQSDNGGYVSHLTASDISYLSSLCGNGCHYVVNSDGSSWFSDANGNEITDASWVSDANGNKITDECMSAIENQVVSLAVSMDCDRECGQLTGSISRKYLEDLFARQSGSGMFSTSFENQALSLIDV